MESIIAEVERDGGGRMLPPGEDAFKLYDTYGFPFELTEEIASERGLQVDKAHFDEAMEAQRERARAARGARMPTLMRRARSIMTQSEI